MFFLIRRVKTYFKEYSIADYFTLSRLLLSPFSIVLILLDEEKWFAAFILILFATDMVDGSLARCTGSVSTKGARLDSLADFLTIIFTIIGSLYFQYKFFSNHVCAISFTIIFYFLSIFLGFGRYGKLSSFHTYLSKFSALLLVYLFWNLFFRELNENIFIVILAVLWTSIFEEIILIFLLPNWRSDVKGLIWVLSAQANKLQKRRTYFKNCFKYR